MIWCIILLLVSIEGKEGIQEEFDEEWWESYSESLYSDTIPVDSTVDSSKIIDTTQNKGVAKKNVMRVYFKSGIQIAAVFAFLIVTLVFLRRKFRL